MKTTNTENSQAGSDCQQHLVRHLDLFSGIGGFALAAQWVGGIETIGFCEIDPWAQKVLTKNFPSVPIHDDIKTIKSKDYGRIDLITGGYPCQPFSAAGERKGETDDRHLWPELFRVIEASRPRMVLCENVAGHINLGLDEVLDDLESEGYAAQPIVIPACAVGARHQRDRVWIMAYANGVKPIWGEANTKKGNKESREEQLSGFLPANSWPTLSSAKAHGTGHGIPDRVDRAKGLGNAVVPQLAAKILRAMMTTDYWPNVKGHPSHTESDHE